MKWRTAAAAVTLAACTVFLFSPAGAVVTEPVASFADRVAKGVEARLHPAEDAEPEAQGLSVPDETPPDPLEPIRAVFVPDLPADPSTADAVRYVRYHGLLSGYANGGFDADGFLTRGQALAAIRRLARLDLSESGASRSVEVVDTETGEVLSAEIGDGGAWAEPYPETGEAAVTADFPDDITGYVLVETGSVKVETDTVKIETAPDATDLQWALDAGIVGAGADPQLDAPVTRGQLAAFLYRLASFLGHDTTCTGDLSLRPDAKAVPEYARVPLSWAMEHDIYRTIVEDSLSPQVPVSRGQAALVLTAWVADATADPAAVEITTDAAKPFFRSASRENHAALQEAVDTIARRYGATGLQVAVIEQGRVSDTYAYGWAVRRAEPMTADHKMRIASLSKVVVGVTAMEMAADGVLDLDAPLGTWWDMEIRNPYYPDIPVTPRNILSHTSSIAVVEGDLSVGAVRRRLASGSIFNRTPPGSIESWEYSNYAIGILGMTMERAAGRNMDTLLDHYFFSAMNIDGGFYAQDVEDTSLLTNIYRYDGTVGRSIAEQMSLRPGAPGSEGSIFAGGLTVSARDMGKIAALLANDGVYEGLRLLPASYVEQMEASAGWTADGFRQGFPLRWRPDAYGRESIYYHTGSAYGVYNGFSYDPSTGDGVVVLTTGASGARDNSGNYAVCGAVFDEIYRAIAR